MIEVSNNYEVNELKRGIRNLTDLSKLVIDINELLSGYRESKYYDDMTEEFVHVRYLKLIEVFPTADLLLLNQLIIEYSGNNQKMNDYIKLNIFDLIGLKTTSDGEKAMQVLAQYKLWKLFPEVSSATQRLMTEYDYYDNYVYPDITLMEQPDVLAKKTLTEKGKNLISIKARRNNIYTFKLKFFFASYQMEIKNEDIGNGIISYPGMGEIVDREYNLRFDIHGMDAERVVKFAFMIVNRYLEAESKLSFDNSFSTTEKADLKELYYKALRKVKK